MKFPRLLTAVLVGSAFAARLSVAQEVEGKAKLGEAEVKARIEVRDDDSGKTINIDKDSSYGRARERSTVDRAHKASKIIGMEVKNHHGELLGEIQDLVVDLSSGRISYAVLASGGFLGIREKYIAIPASALSPAADDNNKLVMNVDKSTIERAHGFVKNHWPDLDSPAWGAGLTPNDLRSEGNVEPRYDTELNVGDRYDRSDSDRPHVTGNARLDRSERDRSLSGQYDRNFRDGKTFRGKITAIDAEKRTMTIETDSGTETFMIAERPTLALKDTRNPHLTDLKVGYSVVVGYHDEGDSHVAHSIMRSDSPEVK